MAIEIAEQFDVAAAVEQVWRFMLDPHQIVTCLPGATLVEVVNDRTFLGQVKVKVGAVMASYKGRIVLTEVDDANHQVTMSAEGKEASGGTAKGTIRSRLEPLADGGTRVVAEATVELTGRLMQVGRGMIQAVAHQIFLQFVAATKARLEIPRPPTAESVLDAASAVADTPTAASPVMEPVVGPVASVDQPLRLLPILWRALVHALRELWERLLGRAESRGPRD